MVKRWDRIQTKERLDAWEESGGTGMALGQLPFPPTRLGVQLLSPHTAAIHTCVLPPEATGPARGCPEKSIHEVEAWMPPLSCRMYLAP